MAPCSNAGTAPSKPPSRAPRLLVAYSVKANGNLALLNLLARLGSGADIVSGGELARALEAGIPAERIVFAGAGKSEEELRAGLDRRDLRLQRREPGGVAPS